MSIYERNKNQSERNKNNLLKETVRSATTKEQRRPIDNRDPSSINSSNRF